MSVFLNELLTGLAGASTLFLVAAGLTVIFGVTRVINFAHGSLFMLGAYIGWSVLTRLPPGPGWFVLGVAVTALAVGAVGAVLEVSLLRRVYRAPALLQLLATYGVVLIVRNLVQVAWGAEDLSLPRPPWLTASLPIGDTAFPRFELILICVAPALLGLMWLLLTRCRWGTLVRAATCDHEMVAALGVDQRWLFTSVFALGAALAGLGGVLALPAGAASLHLDMEVVTDAFVVVVVGGMGSLPGAYLAALLIGVLRAFGILLLPGLTLVFVFLLMALVLLLRPQGLLGTAEAEGTPPADLVLLRAGGPGLRLAFGLVLAGALAAPWVLGPFPLAILTEGLIALLFAASLHVLVGPGGIISFGHAAWFGIGAYAAAVATSVLHLPMAAGLALGLLISGMLALAFGGLVTRLGGIALAMLTLAFAEIVWASAVQSPLLGGDNGLLGVWPDGWAASARGFYLLALTLAVAGALLLRRVLLSPFGFALRAVRDSPLRAAAIGLDAAKLRAAAFGCAGAAAGLAGALSAYSKGSVFPSVAGVDRSIDGLLMVLLGGVQTLSGPVLGALFYTGLYDLLLSATLWWRLFLGLAIVALVLLFPEGLGGMWRRRWEGGAA